MTAKTQQVGIREFREHLASYLLQSTALVAITRHGDTIGYYLPVPRKQPDWAALECSSAELRKSMKTAGVTEDEIIEDFKQLRKSSKK